MFLSRSKEAFKRGFCLGKKTTEKLIFFFINIAWGLFIFTWRKLSWYISLKKRRQRYHFLWNLVVDYDVFVAWKSFFSGLRDWPSRQNRWITFLPGKICSCSPPPPHEVCITKRDYNNFSPITYSIYKVDDRTYI